MVEDYFKRCAYPKDAYIPRHAFVRHIRNYLLYENEVLLEIDEIEYDRKLEATYFVMKLARQDDEGETYYALGVIEDDTDSFRAFGDFHGSIDDLGFDLATYEWGVFDGDDRSSMTRDWPSFL